MQKTDTLRLLERALDASSMRSWALSNNIANANTPGYKRLDVDFARALKDASQAGTALAATHANHLQARAGAGAPALVSQDSSMRVDGNSVDVEFEMVRAAENSIYFAALSRQLSDRLQRLRLAITEGRR